MCELLCVQVSGCECLHLYGYECFTASTSIHLPICYERLTDMDTLILHSMGIAADACVNISFKTNNAYTYTYRHAHKRTAFDTEKILFYWITRRNGTRFAAFRTLINVLTRAWFIPVSWYSYVEWCYASNYYGMYVERTASSLSHYVLTMRGEKMRLCAYLMRQKRQKWKKKEQKHTHTHLNSLEPCACACNSVFDVAVS